MTSTTGSIDLGNTPGDAEVRVLPAPDGGWFGPRGVAVAPDGTMLVQAGLVALVALQI